MDQLELNNDVSLANTIQIIVRLQASGENSAFTLHSAEVPNLGATPVVTHILPSLDIGGMEQVVIALALGMRERGWQAHVICTQQAGSMAPRLVEQGIPVHVSRFHKWTDNIASSSLSQLVRQTGADVVHSHTGVWLGGVTAAKRARVRAVCHTEHGLMGSEPWKLRVQKVAAARLTDAIVVVSDPLRAALSKQCWISPQCLIRIDNGVDEARFTVSEEVGLAVRAELGISPKDVIVGCVARLHHLKGVDVLLSAFVDSTNRNHNTHLLIVGDGEDRDNLVELSRGTSIPVQFLGARSDVHRLLQAFDIYVQPSRSEGLPIALLEAMAAGCAIVASAVGEIPTVLKNNAGLLVPREDPKALYQAIKSLIQDDASRATLSANARKRVLSSYSQQSMVDAYSRVYEQLLR